MYVFCVYLINDFSLTFRSERLPPNFTAGVYSQTKVYLESIFPRTKRISFERLHIVTTQSRLHKVRSVSLHKQISNDHSTDIINVQQFQQCFSLTQTNLQPGIDNTEKRHQALCLFVAALSFVLFLCCRGSKKRWVFPKLLREQEQGTTCSQLSRSGALWEQGTNSRGLHI